ncbi:MAG TPA: DNA-binding domain-containing protein [Trinickia sp.]|nr:DNA-binding domain-containing protein [Trinickia sp.]
MLSYGDVLDDFAEALLDDARTPAGITAQTRARIGVYRNNVRLNRIAALTDAFANVVMLVGVEYFHALARAYVIATPATSTNLHDDGAALPAFIRGFAPAAELPYLADVAQVDWLMRRAYYADDAAELDRSVLAALGAGRFGAASLRLAPSVGVARSSAWPIADILAMHAGGTTARLDAGGQSVLIWRERFTVRWQALGEPEAQAVVALLEGAPIEATLTPAGVDIDWLFSQLFGHRLVCAIEEHREDRSSSASSP